MVNTLKGIIKKLKSITGGKKESREILKGIYLTDKGTAVACDGYRATEIKHEVEGTGLISGADVNKKAADLKEENIQLNNDCDFGILKNLDQIFEGSKDSDVDFEVNIGDFQKEFKRLYNMLGMKKIGTTKKAYLMIVSNKGRYELRFKPDRVEEMYLQGTEVFYDGGKWLTTDITDIINVTKKDTKKDMKILFNAKFIYDVLAIHDKHENVTVKYTSSVTPMIIENDSARSIVLPIRVVRQNEQPCWSIEDIEREIAAATSAAVAPEAPEVPEVAAMSMIESAVNEAALETAVEEVVAEIKAEEAAGESVPVVEALETALNEVVSEVKAASGEAEEAAGENKTCKEEVKTYDNDVNSCKEDAETCNDNTDTCDNTLKTSGEDTTFNEEKYQFNNFLLNRIKDSTIAARIMAALREDKDIGYSLNARGIPSPDYEDTEISLVISPTPLQAEYLDGYIESIDRQSTKLYSEELYSWYKQQQQDKDKAMKCFRNHYKNSKVRLKLQYPSEILISDFIRRYDRWQGLGNTA